MTLAGSIPSTPSWVGRLRQSFQRRVVAYPVATLIMLLTSLATIVMRRRVQSPFGLSTYDTLYYVRQANTISGSGWLGPYNNLTLAKVPGYALFVSVCDYVGLPVKVGEQLVALAAALVTAACMLAVTKKLWWAVLAFVVLAFDPIYLTAAAADLSRDALFASVSVLLLSSLFLAGYLAVFERRIVWSLVAGAAGGLSLAAYVLIREEGSSVFPTAVAALGAAPLLRALQTRVWRRASWRNEALGRRALRSTLRTVPALLAIVAMAVGPLAVVMVKNDRAYGVALTSDFPYGSFMDAYAEWQRVDAGPHLYRIPISEAQRQAVYPVSAAARQLEPVLEDPNNPWLRRACLGHVICDYPGDWTNWVLRDAAQAIGAYRSAPAAQAFWAALAQQIGRACDDGRLTCQPRLPASLQPLTSITPANFVEATERLSTAAMSSLAMYGNVTSVVTIPADIRAEFVAADPSLPATPEAADQAQAAFNQHYWMYRALNIVYTALIPVAASVGLILLVLVLVFRRGRGAAGPLTALSLVLLFGFVARILVLAVVDAADYSTVQPRYLFPAHALLLAFAVVSVFAGIQTLDLKRLGEIVRHPRADTGPDTAAVIDRPEPADDTHAVSPAPTEQAVQIDEVWNDFDAEGEQPKHAERAPVDNLPHA